MKSNQFKYLKTFSVGVLVMGLAFTSCKNSPVTSSDEKEEISPSIEMMSEPGYAADGNTSTNVYISDSNTDTYDPLFPATADPNWATSVCYQENSFGIDATWSNPHKAFEVGPHPWESGTFDAEWINAANTLSSDGTVDESDKSGPNGHNWTRYDKQVVGDGEFVIQLLADNCSWVYLADENGNSPQLVGYQGAVSTPGEYGVALNGNHTLTFIIYDGGGAAGGKFRLETTESYGGDTPDPIIDTTPPVISYSQETSNLWPPNHKMVLVATGISADDNVDGATDVTVTVSSNEASNGKGDGNTDTDYEIVSNPDGTQDVYVRSERSGKNNGRTYTITMSATDTAGNNATESIEVQVAKSQKGGRR